MKKIKMNLTHLLNHFKNETLSNVSKVWTLFLLVYNDLHHFRSPSCMVISWSYIHSDISIFWRKKECHTPFLRFASYLYKIIQTRPILSKLRQTQLNLAHLGSTRLNSAQLGSTFLFPSFYIWLSAQLSSQLSTQLLANLSARLSIWFSDISQSDY